MSATLRVLAAVLATALPASAAPSAEVGDSSNPDRLAPDRLLAESVLPALAEPPDDGRGTPYVVDKEDNICGLDEPRQISRPAKVDYQKLLDATEEVKEIKRKKIDPNSAKGIELMSKARARVLRACEKVRSEGSYCSVWKKIELRDPKKGTKPVDITSEVKTEIEKE